MATGPNTQTLIERLERWQNQPETETSISAQIARRLWAGETISPMAMQADYHTTASLTGVIVRDLRQVGWQIETTREPGRGNAVTYQVTGRGQPLPDRVKGRAKPAARAVRQPPTREVAPRAEPRAAAYPPLGASLSVRALALTDAGVILQLSDGNGSAWQCTITGHVG
jgi:hypothetical protein